MADAVFVDGVPAKITIHDFRRHCLYSFPALASSDFDGLLTDAIDTVYSVFAGVGELWDLHPRQLWYDKTVLCYRFLVCWLIADHYPEFSSRNQTIDILKRKKIDGVDMVFNTDLIAGSNPLTKLNSNDFGRKALMMIQTAAKRAFLRSCRTV